MRDLIIGRPTTDFDLVIRGVNKAKLEKELSRLGQVDLVGKRFGVFKFRPNKWLGPEIDIALPRTEHSLHFSGAYRDFKIKSDTRLKIEDDLSRRDFTINAMAWDIFQAKLLDPFGGFPDSKKKVIRAVGVAPLRFKEDYSRMLRAIRFSCQLDFTIAPTAWQAIKSNIKKINLEKEGQRIVPYEVIAQELAKTFRHHPTKALKLLDESGALAVLMPELLRMKNCPQPKNFHSEGDVWRHTNLALTKLTSPEFKKEFPKTDLPDEVIWAVIFHDLGKPFTITKTDRLRYNNHDVVSAQKFHQIAERLKLAATGLKVDQIEIMVRKHMLAAHGDVNAMKATTMEKYFFSDNFPGQQLLMLMFADIGATIWQNGKPNFRDYKKIKIRISQLVKKSRGKKALARPLVNGHDIMKAFKLKPGPKIGTLLALAREAQLRGKIKTKAAGLKYLKKQQ